MLTRRTFLLHGAAALTVAGCSDGPTAAPPTTASATTTAGGAPGSIPSSDTIHHWIEQIVARGIRRPAYDADEWTEDFVADELRRLGVDRVTTEPVDVTRWEPTSWALDVVTGDGDSFAVDCFPVPYSAPVDGLELELVRFDDTDPAAVAGKAALVSAAVARIAPDALVGAGSAPVDPAGRVHDPDGSFAGTEHVLPHTAQRNRILDPVVAAGAAAFVGTLVDYPGDGHDYFVPYHGEPIPVPGVWISGSDGRRLLDLVAADPVQVRLTVRSTAVPARSRNVVGELDGADDEVVIIASHHDGPWASAVEDASGVALVLAQAAYWAAQPRDARPHRLRFVLHAGHMCGGAGAEAYVEAHTAELPSVVLEIHLEHAGLDVDEDMAPLDRCVPRWWFTSRIPPLEAAVSGALVDEDLRRSMVLAPDALGENPPTDGAAYFRAGVPIVHFLAAPAYLFDSADTLDKVDRANLEPLTRATIRIVEATAGWNAADLRSAGLPTAG
jgi:hypothetical protein